MDKNKLQFYDKIWFSSTYFMIKDYTEDYHNVYFKLNKEKDKSIIYRKTGPAFIVSINNGLKSYIWMENKNNLNGSSCFRKNGPAAMYADESKLWKTLLSQKPTFEENYWNY